MTTRKQQEEETKKRVETVNATENNNQQTKESMSSDRGNIRGRTKRKKNYEEVRETDIPMEIQKMFEAEGWKLRFLRYYVNGQPDYRYLSKRERQGFEFVQLDELPAWYRSSFTVEDDRHRKGLLVSGDVVLAKVDVDLVEDRRRVLNRRTDALVNAVDINVLKNKGYVDLGSKSSISNKEPSFSE